MYRASGRKIDCLENADGDLPGIALLLTSLPQQPTSPKLQSPCQTNNLLVLIKIVFARITVTGISNYELRLELLNSANKLASPPLSASQAITWMS
jgi:hypothetical protein